MEPNFPILSRIIINLNIIQIFIKLNQADILPKETTLIEMEYKLNNQLAMDAPSLSLNLNPA